MATKAMSAMTLSELVQARDVTIADRKYLASRSYDSKDLSIAHIEQMLHLILANQYDAELTRREKEKA